MIELHHPDEESDPLHMWIPSEEVEEQAMNQLYNTAKLPQVRGVAVMPDVHYGIGATVGSVIAMKDAICPAAVGVDIGCGMTAVWTTLRGSDLPDDLSHLRHRIEQAIPVGKEMHPDGGLDMREITPAITGWNAFWGDFHNVTEAVHPRLSRARAQMGSLGGGNHFIEVCLDEHDNVWLMLHSGSRNIGKELADYHIGVAQTLPHNKDLPDKDLSVFLAGGPTMAAYRRDLYWAQEYASRNRQVMMLLLKRVLEVYFAERKIYAIGYPLETSCHHNYVSEETYDFGDGPEEVFVTRKGAISARKRQFGIIPGSMGTNSYIVKGLGSELSFNSAPHGAGRRMSRGQARRTFSVKDLQRQTLGVECRKDEGVLDEIPEAYKDIDQVIRYSSDLVEVYATLRQVLCVKG